MGAVQPAARRTAFADGRVLARGPGVCLAVQLGLGDPDRHARLHVLAVSDRAAALTRWRPAAWFVGGAFALIVAEGLVTAAHFWSDPFSSQAQSTSAPTMLLILLPATLLVSAAAVVVRFAGTAGEERLQLKWFPAAALPVVATFIASVVSYSAGANLLQNLAFLCLWAAIAIAILKYRLYDIDRIISRTLAYAIVTGLLVGVYAGLVLLATQVLSFSSPVAVAASTLAAAAPDTRRQAAVPRRERHDQRQPAHRCIRPGP